MIGNQEKKLPNHEPDSTSQVGLLRRKTHKKYALKSSIRFFYKRLLEVEQAAVTTKGAIRAFPLGGPRGMLALKNLKFISSEISRILGIRKSVVYDNFYRPMNTVFEEGNVLDSLLIYF